MRTGLLDKTGFGSIAAKKVTFVPLLSRLGLVYTSKAGLRLFIYRRVIVIDEYIKKKKNHTLCELLKCSRWEMTQIY